MSKRFWIKASGLALVLALAAGALVAWLNVRGEEPIPAQAPALQPTPQLLARGAYLARAGNCAACHTQRGGAPYAGVRFEVNTVPNGVSMPLPPA